VKRRPLQSRMPWTREFPEPIKIKDGRTIAILGQARAHGRAARAPSVETILAICGVAFGFRRAGVAPPAAGFVG
jgi:hypothetical protein